jgi:cytochrome P450/NADPH-cytochrome P450 reductase
LALREKGIDVGPSLLFFGCRHPDHDFLYRDELRAFAEAGVTRLVCAFSRLDSAAEPAGPAPSSNRHVDVAGRTYVQHQIVAQGEAVWSLLERGAVVYVCGASHMAAEARRAFVEVLQSHGGRDQATAERSLAELQESRRYLVDVWASG